MGRRRPPRGAQPAAMISYAWADKDLVRPLVAKLEHMNVRVWIDVKNMGSDINEAMIDGIRRAAVVVAFLSDSYIASHNCKLEIKFANDIHKPIIPVRLASTENVVFSAAAFVTAGQLYIDLTKGVGANSHEAIAARILKLSTTSLEAITISSTDVVVSDNKDSIVGEGSFGMVRKGLYLESIPIAVKTLKLAKLSEKSKLELINEANILQKSRHPFIIGFHGVINIDDNFSLVLEFASLGSLYDYYVNPDNEDAPLKQRLTFLIQISAGMSYLHDTLKILHNDLKSLNILLTKTDQDGSIVSKITDFGLSKIKNETMTRSTSSAAAGSILWLAPERASTRQKVSTANDVYSFAVLMTEVISWTGAYGIAWEDSDINVQGFVHALQKPKERDNLLQELQSDVFQAETAAGSLLASLFKRCWSLEISDRPRFSAICLELKALTELVQEEPDVAETVEDSHKAIAAETLKLPTTSLEAVTISSSDLVVSDNRDSIVGEGSFGMVRKGLYLESIPVAVKTLKLSKLSKKSKLKLINHANILQKSHHPFVIGFHGVVSIDDNFSLVSEFASLGSLHDYYLNPDNKDTPLKQRLTFLIQVSAGMSYLHDTLKMTHNDLKSLNIVLTKTYQDGSIVSKITDFGLSKIRTETVTCSNSSAAAASVLWLAPELMSVRQKVSSANNVYSFAVLMTEVTSWTGAYGIPWENTEINLQDFIAALSVQEERGNLLQELQSDVFHSETAAGAALASLFERCWSLEISYRPRFSAICLELKALTELVEIQPDVAEPAEG
ncbi:kinase-like domain-containing protein [Zopfochytrium polystomum]|nr:kinase-like domain-containing protein [Zopfochytrium polystomum]